MKLNIILFIYFITSLLGLMYVVNKQPINNEPYNGYIRNDLGIFLKDSSLTVSVHTDLQGRYYTITNIKNADGVFHIEELIPEKVFKGNLFGDEQAAKDYKQSIYNSFRGRGER